GAHQNSQNAGGHAAFLHIAGRGFHAGLGLVLGWVVHGLLTGILVVIVIIWHRDPFLSRATPSQMGAVGGLLFHRSRDAVFSSVLILHYHFLEIKRRALKVR